jgi:hypothetical protein
MRPNRREKLLVFHVPDIDIGPTRDIGNQLAESPVGIPAAQLGEVLEQFGAIWRNRGRTSFALLVTTRPLRLRAAE